MRSAETGPAFPISMSSFCALMAFIWSDRYSLRDPRTVRRIEAFKYRTIARLINDTQTD
jgi:hypothetical protein